MKEIKAIIQPFMADEVIGALRAMPGLPGLTVSRVKGFGRSHITGNPDELDATFGAEKIKLEIVVPAHMAEKVTCMIAERAHTGNPGDGKIFIHTVDEVLRIRTGERGDAAL